MKIDSYTVRYEWKHTWRKIGSRGWRAFGRQKPGTRTGPPYPRVKSMFSHSHKQSKKFQVHIIKHPSMYI